MNLQIFAKDLRKKSTDAESTLWYYLRAKRLSGLKFKRQQPIGKYIVDFVCFEKRVIIELDGSQHLQNEAYDRTRDTWLKSEGYQVLRFNNVEFFQNKEAVVEKIADVCLSHPSPGLRPPSPPRGEGK